MAKKSAVLTISIWDNHVRLSLISKTMATITAKSFELSVDVDALGLRHVDPFELIYFIRTGVQQCLTDADVVPILACLLCPVTSWLGYRSMHPCHTPLFTK